MPEWGHLALTISTLVVAGSWLAWRWLGPRQEVGCHSCAAGLPVPASQPRGRRSRQLKVIS